jgi:FixJ family two-component response regulator
MSVPRRKTGAAEFLTKPFNDRNLLDAIAQAIGRSQSARKDQV